MTPAGRPPVEKQARSRMVFVRVTPTLGAALDRIAREDGVPASDVLRRLIAEEAKRRQPKPRKS